MGGYFSCTEQCHFNLCVDCYDIPNNQRISYLEERQEDTLTSQDPFIEAADNRDEKSLTSCN